MTSKLPTTTDPDWLHNSHAGELLESEFMDPLGLDCAALAKAIAVDSARLRAMFDGTKALNGELDRIEPRAA